MENRFAIGHVEKTDNKIAMHLETPAGQPIFGATQHDSLMKDLGDMNATSPKRSESVSYGVTGNSVLTMRAKDLRTTYVLGLLKSIATPIAAFLASLRREKARASSEAAFISMNAHTLSDIGVDKAAMAPLVASSEPESAPAAANDDRLRVA